MSFYEELQLDVNELTAILEKVQRPNIKAHLLKLKEDFEEQIRVDAQSRKEQQSHAKLLPLTEDLAFSRQPSPQQLQNLDKIGIRGVLSLQDTNDPASLSNEKELIASSGATYANLPIHGIDEFNDAYAEKLVKELDALPKPALVYCQNGLCSCAAAILKVALDSKHTDEPVSAVDCLKWGLDLGYNLANHAAFYAYLSKALK